MTDSDSSTDVSEDRSLSVVIEEKQDVKVETKVPTIEVKELPPELSPEEIKEFFQAVEGGAINRLEDLFAQKTDADPNMTQFTESLLMAAIRNNQSEVAEYLIDQWAINVQHTSDMREFRPNASVQLRYRTYSCRDLAYQQGMMNLVDLIDLLSDDVNPAIKRHLKRRLQDRISSIQKAHINRLKMRQRNFLLSRPKLSNESLTRASSLPKTSYQSHINKVVQSISVPDELSIDDTGKKTFRFSNYNLRFRLMDSPPSKPKVSPPRTMSLASSSLPSFLTTKTSLTRPSVTQHSTRIPVRENRTSIQRSSTFLLTPRPEQPKIIDLQKRSLPTRSKTFYTKPHYTFQTPTSMIYNVTSYPWRPATFESNSIGLSSNSTMIRN